MWRAGVEFFESGQLESVGTKIKNKEETTRTFFRTV